MAAVRRIPDPGEAVGADCGVGTDRGLRRPAHAVEDDETGGGRRCFAIAGQHLDRIDARKGRRLGTDSRGQRGERLGTAAGDDLDAVGSVADRTGKTECLSALDTPIDDLTLTLIVTQRQPGFQFMLSDRGHDRLALRDQVYDTAVNVIQAVAQLEQFGGG